MAEGLEGRFPGTGRFAAYANIRTSSPKAALDMYVTTSHNFMEEELLRVPQTKI
jgi:hypothetical protein